MELALNQILHLFIPRESNNHKAKILHSKSLLVLLIGIFVYQIFVSTLSTHPVSVLGYAANISPSDVINLTNQKRKEAGLTQLSYSEQLTKAAQAKATDMINRDYWSHVAPDGTQPWKFFADQGYKYKYAGENLARDFRDPKSTVDAWMSSSSHRENLLSTRYKEIGIAVIEGDLLGHDTTIVVQLFGTKLSDTSKSITTVSASDVAPGKQVVENQLAVSPAPVVSGAALAFDGKSQQVSSFDATKYGSLLLTVVLGSIIFIDAFIVWKQKIPRISGRAFAHLSFFGMIVTIIVIMKAGNII